jgi:CheY-like chemotaxis protein
MSHPSNSKRHYFLLVDDDEDDRDLFSELMNEISSESKIKTLDGHKSLTHYLSHADGSLPDLIFLDINMPGKDGIQLLQWLKSEKKFAHIPVVMYTTSSSPDFIEKSRSLGAYAYICKPNNVSLIKSVLSKIFNADWSKILKNDHFVLGL